MKSEPHRQRRRRQVADTALEFVKRFSQGRDDHPAGGRRTRRGQAVVSWATFAGWRIRMAFPKGSRTPMSVP